MAFSDLTGVPWEVIEAEGPGLFGDVDAFMVAYEQGREAAAWNVLHDAVMVRLDHIVSHRVHCYDRSAMPNPFNEDDIGGDSEA